MNSRWSMSASRVGIVAALDVAVVGRQIQRRPPALVGEVDIGAVLDEELRRAGSCGSASRRAAGSSRSRSSGSRRRRPRAARAPHRRCRRAPHRPAASARRRRLPRRAAIAACRRRQSTKPNAVALNVARARRSGTRPPRRPPPAPHPRPLFGGPAPASSLRSGRLLIAQDRDALPPRPRSRGSLDLPSAAVRPSRTTGADVGRDVGAALDQHAR